MISSCHAGHMIARIQRQTSSLCIWFLYIRFESTGTAIRQLFSPASDCSATINRISLTLHAFCAHSTLTLWFIHDNKCSSFCLTWYGLVSPLCICCCDTCCVPRLTSEQAQSACFFLSAGTQPNCEHVPRHSDGGLYCWCMFAPLHRVTGHLQPGHFVHQHSSTRQTSM